MFRQDQLAVHGLAILLGRNEVGISNRGKFLCTTLYKEAIWGVHASQVRRVAPSDFPFVYQMAARA